MKTTVHCFNETDPLLEVIIGYPDNLHADPTAIEIVNATQAALYYTSDCPTATTAIPEFQSFRFAMESQGITVHTPQPCNVSDQLTPRDIGFVIGDTFFVANMAKKSRKQEWYGIKHLIDQFANVVYVPDDLVIEGGDIVVDKNQVFVGISQRTTIEGYEWLKSQLPQDLSCTPILLKSLEEGEDCLHLDCVFVPVGSNHALIYPDGIKEIPPQLNQYHWLEVTRDEQIALATNVLSLSPTIVISRDIATRVNALLEGIGITVIPLVFNEAPKTGGSFRCCTLPLNRKS